MCCWKGRWFIISLHFKIINKYKNKLHIFPFCLYYFQNHLLGTYYIPGTLLYIKILYVTSTVHATSIFLPNPKYSSTQIDSNADLHSS